MLSIDTDNLTVNNIAMMGEIAGTELTKKYTDKCLAHGELCQYAYYGGEVPVGYVVSTELRPASDGPKEAPLGLCVTALKVLPAYKENYGVEEALLKYIEKVGKNRHLTTGYVHTADLDSTKYGYSVPETEVKYSNQLDGEASLVSKSLSLD